MGGARVRGSALLLGMMLGACVGADAYQCAEDAQCSAAGSAGVCQDIGFCSFPDEGCDSGQRYGEHAGALSHTCVPTAPGPTGDGSGGDDGAVSLDGAATTSGTDGATSTGPPGGDSSMGADGTTGDAEIVFTDDELEGEFGEGTFVDTVWSGDDVRLQPGQVAGQFVSRVFDAQGPDAAWQTIAWTPGAPYGKPLPAGEAAESGYVQDGIDMSGNVLLLRFDERGMLPSGAVVADLSGHGNAAEVVAPSGLPTSEGKLGRAVVDGADTYLRVAMSDDLQLGTEDFTWAMWAKTTSDCAGPDVSSNQVYLGTEDEGVDRAHVWFGCVRPLSSSCASATGGGFAGGTFRAVHDADDGGFCGTTDITDGQWHHMAVVKSGHPDSTLLLYVDGQLEASVDTTFAAPIEFFDDPEVAIGAFSNGSFQAAVSLDELAIWRRALSEEEIGALHRRGAHRLRLEVRACDDAACVGEAFEGPGGASEAFEDPADGLSPPGPQPLGTMPIGRWFQYSVSFQSDAAVSIASPGLREVTVSAIR